MTSKSTEQRWKRKILEFDRKVKREENRNKKAIEKLKKYKSGHTDGTENNIHSVNSLSDDPHFWSEIRHWRKALKDLKR